MTFSGKEMTAVLKAAKLIAVADGKVTEAERNAILADLKSFGFVPNSLESTVLEGLADNMNNVADVIAKTRQRQNNQFTKLFHTKRFGEEEYSWLAIYD